MICRYRLSSGKRRKKAMQLMDSVYYLSERITEVRMGEANEIEVEYEGEDEKGFQAILDQYLNISLQTRLFAQIIIHDNRTSSKNNQAGNLADYRGRGTVSFICEKSFISVKRSG